MLATLRSKIFGALRRSDLSALASKEPLAPRLREHYFPDVDVAKLSAQDTTLRELKLKDVWVEARLAREQDLIKRGKVVRFGVLSGRRKSEAEEGGKKKKKKK